MGFGNIIKGIAGFITGGASNVIQTVGDVIDKLTTTDEEKLKLKKVLNDQMNQFTLDVLDRQNREQEELTKRLQADMTSDSWLSKNIRPLTLIFILIMFSVLSIGNSFGMVVDEAYISMLKVWGVLAFSFYFGSRWNEKITKIKKQ